MTLRIRCPRCERELNIPLGAESRKLRCPKCLEEFRAGGPSAPSRPSEPVIELKRPASSPSMPNLPLPTSGLEEEPDLPSFSGDLRDQFELPLLREADERPARPAARPPSGPIPSPRPEPAAAPASPFAEADAAGLLEDDEPIRPRRLAKAEQRSAARRCSCGGVVPAGMSICPRCGLDLETGTRDQTLELLEVDVPIRVVSAPPMGVMFVGVTAGLVGGILALVSLALYITQSEAPHRWGFLLLSAVSGFGLYAAVRLVRNRSPRLLLVALMLGGLIDLASMVILPITLASTGQVAKIDPEADHDDAPIGPAEPMDAMLVDGQLVPRIVPLTERIDWDQVTLGLAILAAASAVAVYLNTSQVRRYTDRR